MTTIPASLFVADNPSVLSAGGSGLVLNGLLLTKSTRVPIGSVMQFGSPLAVQNFFGGVSAEANFAGGGTNLGSGYFGGFDTSTIKPGNLLVAQYNPAAVNAYLWGGNASAIIAPIPPELWRALVDESLLLDNPCFQVSEESLA